MACRKSTKMSPMHVTLKAGVTKYVSGNKQLTNMVVPKEYKKSALEFEVT